MVDQIPLEHQMRLRFLDGNGQLVGVDRELEQEVVFQPLSENRLGRRVPVEFNNGVIVEAGDYRSRST